MEKVFVWWADHLEKWLLIGIELVNGFCCKCQNIMAPSPWLWFLWRKWIGRKKICIIIGMTGWMKCSRHIITYVIIHFDNSQKVGWYKYLLKGFDPLGFAWPKTVLHCAWLQTFSYSLRIWQAYNACSTCTQSSAQSRTHQVTSTLRHVKCRRWCWIPLWRTHNLSSLRDRMMKVCAVEHMFQWLCHHGTGNCLEKLLQLPLI